MLDTRGFIAETNATHLFFVERGVVRTPTHRRLPRRASPAPRCSSCAAAHGIPHEVTDLSLTEVYRADEVFCTGTMGELRRGHDDRRPDDRRRPRRADDPAPDARCSAS